MSGAAPAFVALTRGGAELARRLAARMPGAEVHGLAGRTEGADVRFDETLAHLRELFAAGRPIVGVCAAGGEGDLTVPLVVRLEGPNVETGREIREGSGLPIITAGDLDRIEPGPAPAVVVEVFEAAVAGPQHERRPDPLLDLQVDRARVGGGERRVIDRLRTAVAVG